MVSRFQAVDVGGSIVFHTFGAYFGLAVSYMLYRKDFLKHDKEGSSYASDIFAMIGKLKQQHFFQNAETVILEPCVFSSAF